MTPTETAAILRQFNEWRRGDEDIPQPDPHEIGEAIDAAIEMIERMRDDLEAVERERDALRARIEAKETALIDWLYANAPGGWIDNLRVRCDTLRAELKAAHAMALNGVEWKELAQKYEAEISAMKRKAAKRAQPEAKP